VIAGGPVSAVLEGAGVRDVLTKTLGTNNPHNVVRATMTALEELRDPVERARELGRS
jgi:small subunit ribosomal protein S5